MQLLERRVSSVVIPFVLIAGLAVVWYLITPVPVGELLFPSPESVRQACIMPGRDLVRHAGLTFGRVALGWAIGVPSGILMGLAMSWSATLRVSCIRLSRASGRFHEWR
jgi:ABC-type nitrate/sulfonate/bicarbonate transport system permease component